MAHRVVAPMIRGVTAIASIVVAGLPVSFVSTIALLPMWRYIEARYGVGAVGHSGPATWCYQVVYAAWAIAAVSAWAIYQRRVRGAPVRSRLTMP